METDGKNLLFDNKRLGLTYGELSEALGVPYSTLTKWVMERRIPFVKLGHLVRFEPESISL